MLADLGGLEIGLIAAALLVGAVVAIVGAKLIGSSAIANARREAEDLINRA